MKLTLEDTLLFEARAGDADGTHLPVIWLLLQHRGKRLRLSIDDTSVTSNYGHMATSE